jgi:outer membrane protein
MRKIFLLILLFFAFEARAEINLQEAIISAYENNPEIKSQGYSVKIAESQKQKSFAGFLPNISADINSGSQKTSISGTETIKGNVNKKSIGLSQDIFNGGADYFDVKRADSSLKKEKSFRSAKEQDIILEVVNSYLDILRFEEIVKIEEENLSSQKRTLEYTEKKLLFKDATKSEFAKAKADYAMAISEKNNAENNLISAKAEFSKLTGIEISRINKLKPINQFISEELVENLNSESLFEEALKNNPEILAANHGIDSAKYQSSSTKSSLSPTLSLNLSASEERNPLYYNNRDYRNNSVYLNLHVPIFNSGVEYSNISEAKNLLYREKSNFDAIRIDVKQQIIEYLGKAKSMNAQYKSLQEQEFANEIYVTTLQEEERLGTKSIIELLRAQQELFAAKRGRANLAYDRISAIFVLKKLIGALTYNSLSDANFFTEFYSVKEPKKSEIIKLEAKPKEVVKKSFRLVRP